MPRTKKDTSGTAKRSDAQRAADARYMAKNKEKNAAAAKARYQSGFRAIGAQVKTSRAAVMIDTYKAHGVTVSEILHAAAYRLTTDGDTAAAQIKADAAAYTAAYAERLHRQPAPTDTDTTSTTPDDPTTEEQE